jgi:uncharacterized integral membrane protein (TIGR00698 family)
MENLTASPAAETAAVDHRTWLYPAAALLAVAVLGSASALLLGAGLALALGNPYQERARPWIHRLLAAAVVGLGLEMNLRTVAAVGERGIGFTAASIAFAFAAGAFLRRALKADRGASLLITVGTAICGGSAIAAAAPVMRSRDRDVTVALGTVFLLNAAALLVFPAIGHRFGLTQTQFGLWGALAIHDTSSVVGATMQYGPKALEIGTTVKLARALWIVPLTLILGFTARRDGGDGVKTKAKRPWFILGFLLAAALVTYLPALRPAGAVLGNGAKRLMVLTLFLIGAGMTRESLKAVGARPLLLGLSLWALVSVTTLTAVLSGWIR